MSWSIIDDPGSLGIGGTFKFRVEGGNIREALCLVEPTRFRPLYWLLQWCLPFVLFETSSLGYHALHLFLCVVTVFLIYNLTRKISGSKIAGFCAASLFSFMPSIGGNWIALGPTEPWIAFFQTGTLLFFLLALDQKNAGRSLHSWGWFAASVSFAIANYFIKETAIVLVGVTLIAALAMFRRAQWRLLCAYVAVNILSAGFVIPFLVRNLRSGGYASNYRFMDRAGEWVTAAKQYGQPFIQDYGVTLYVSIIALMCLLAYRLVVQRRLDLITRWQIICLIWFGALFSIQLPWPQSLSRYLLPSAVPLSILMGLVFGQLLNLWRKDNRKPVYKRVIIAIALAGWLGGGVIFMTGLPALHGRVMAAVQDNQRKAALVAGINELVPDGGKVMFSVPDGGLEWMTGICLFIQDIYGRRGSVSCERWTGQLDLLYSNRDIIVVIDQDPQIVRQFFANELRELPELNIDSWATVFQVALGSQAEPRAEALGTLRDNSAKPAERGLSHLKLSKSLEATGRIDAAILHAWLAADLDVPGARSELGRLCQSGRGQYAGLPMCPKPLASTKYDVQLLKNFQPGDKTVFAPRGSATFAKLNHSINCSGGYRGSCAERLDVNYRDYSSTTNGFFLMSVRVPLDRETRFSWAYQGAPGSGMLVEVWFRGANKQGVMWDGGDCGLAQRYALDAFRLNDLKWQVMVSPDVYNWALSAAKQMGWSTDRMEATAIGFHAHALHARPVAIDHITVWRAP